MKAIIMASGFQQSEKRANAFEDMFFDDIRLLAGDEVTTYHPRTWTMNVHALASQLQRRRIKHVAALSFSHGQAAITAMGRIARQYGFLIDVWCACDPIYRPTWAPRNLLGQLLSVRAVVGNPKIWVPDTIRRVTYVRQKINKPAGHKLEARNPYLTYVEKPQTLPYSHYAIAHSDEWREMVMRELTHWLHPPKAEPA
jgi:hypothetical protein